jgi:hypothetical protein
VTRERRYHGPKFVLVGVDKSISLAAIVADQINQEAPRMKSYMKPLHAKVQRLLAEIGEGRVRISWLPRELNREADQRASDAFFKRVNNTWLSPESSSLLE